MARSSLWQSMLVCLVEIAFLTSARIECIRARQEGSPFARLYLRHQLTLEVRLLLVMLLLPTFREATNETNARDATLTRETRSADSKIYKNRRRRERGQ